MREFVPAMIAYVLTLAASILLLILVPMPRAVMIVVALLPVLPMGLVMRSILRNLQRLDELQRRIELAPLSVVAFSTWFGLMTSCLLQHAGTLLPSLSLGFGGIALLYLLARRWTSRHYA